MLLPVKSFWTAAPSPAATRSTAFSSSRANWRSPGRSSSAPAPGNRLAVVSSSNPTPHSPRTTEPARSTLKREPASNPLPIPRSSSLPTSRSNSASNRLWPLSLRHNRFNGATGVSRVCPERSRRVHPCPCSSIAEGRRCPALHRQAYRIEFLLTMKTQIVLTLSLALAVPVYAQTAVSAKAREIHNSAIVVDTHADTPQRFLDENYDIGSTDPKDHGHISLDKAKAGNLGAEFFSIWVEPDTNQGRYARHTLDLIDSVYEQAARHADRIMMAFSVDDIVRAHEQHKFAALMGIEGGHSIENDIRLLREFYRLGVRYMTLTWSNTNEWGDSSGDINDPKVEHHNGLTDFGKQVVLEMNRLGVMVDISHVADKTFYDAVASSQA